MAGLPSVALKVWHNSRTGHLEAVTSVEEHDRPLKEFPLENGFDILRVYLPPGTFVDAYKPAHVLDVYLHPPRKFPEICVIDQDKGLRCPPRLEETDYIWAARPVYKLFRALDYLFEKKPELDRRMRDLVLTFIVDMDGTHSSIASALLHGSGTCDIYINSDFFSRGDVPDLAKAIAHEFAHCFENYARTVRREPKGKGKWEHRDGQFIPYGYETRAEHFARRAVR